MPLGGNGPAYESADVRDNVYYDGKIAEQAILKLQELKNIKQPFFFGLGFIRPHLPFNCPKKYWDLYDEDNIKLTDHSNMPLNAPKEANFYSGELKSYTSFEKNKEPILDKEAVRLKHGYMACVSFIDAQIGKVITRLQELEMYDNTIIVLWGDHGWSLGEHGHWGKHTNFNNALQVPLLIHAPGFAQGEKSNSLVSLIDLYPTLCDLSGIELPVHLQGKSIKGILNNTNQEINMYMFSKWKKGESVKYNDFLYTEFYHKKTGAYVSNMLYNHKKDPKETVNVVGVQEYNTVVENLKRVLNNHIKNRSTN